ncbi:MAG: hypothetical protein KF841_14325 [Phycisphaerae bacterium]|nr:hypothetical protein [Phycisphaerae bacterium]
MKLSLKFKWFDLWLGAFWDRDRNTLYVCILPCLPIVIDFRKASDIADDEMETSIERAFDRSKKEPLSAWSDKRVEHAFHLNRGPEDISILNCPECGADSFYDDNDKFWCHHCTRFFVVIHDDEPTPCGRFIRVMKFARTLSDVMPETEEEARK